MNTARSSFCALILAAALVMPAAARAEMEPQPVAKLRTLDKVTARTMTFEADVGSTVKFGPLFIKIRSCQKAPPVEQPESAAFLQIWENSLKDKTPQWVFSGWMFASSPALSPMDHPIYDVWVLDCLAAKTGTAPATETATPEESAPADAADAPDASAAQAAPVKPAAPVTDPAPVAVPEEEIPVEDELIDEGTAPSPETEDAVGGMPVEDVAPAEDTGAMTAPYDASPVP
jgi:hypothetical protein